MQIKEANLKQKTALILVNNEIILNAVKGVLEGMGYTVCRDVESSAQADFGFVAGFFLHLGILHQLHGVNPSLPLVLIVDAEYRLNGNFKLIDEFYDTIEFNNHDEKEISQKITQWFSEGHGKLLVKRDT
jgi:hypothetical protein